MLAQWVVKTGGLRDAVSATTLATLRSLAQPERVRLWRQLLLAVMTAWLAVSLARLFWALLPVPSSAVADNPVVINPAMPVAEVSARVSVPIDQMVAWHLFGEVGSETLASVAAPVSPPQDRAGIEQGARQSRLDLKLRGVVSSTQDGLGYAVIEYKSRQDIYAVDDKLPVPGQVVLAKVMPQQVVLDHGGTYELLSLFVASELDDQLPANAPPGGATASAYTRSPARPAPSAEDSTSVAASKAALASSYRQRLYQDPQSLARVATVSAVRENGELLGYRIGPGTDAQQFSQLGFRDGDLVTSINGFALNDPANTVRLYQAMRSAGEAVFDIQRDGSSLTVRVNMNEPATKQ